MSSSNLVEITLIEESVLGETPGAGNFKTARYTSESLSGTPETTESTLIRKDRMSSGQVVTGLTVNGDIATEIAKDPVLDLLFESLMLSDFQTSVAVNVDLTIDNTAKTIDRAAGDFNADLVVGDFIRLAGFSTAGNNVEVLVAEIVDADTIRYVGPEGMADEAGSGTSYLLADKIGIGSDKKSFSMQKQFTDLTNKALIYKGQLVSNASIAINYGEISNATFSFNGTFRDDVDQATDFITDGRTVDPAATTNPMNGSIDMPFIANSAVGNLDDSNFCIQSVEVSVNNNYTPQTCIGTIAPKDYSPGQAQVEVNLTAYLDDENWQLIAKKLTQEPFAVAFLIKNAGGLYAFYMPAVQVSFEDPSSQGQNQDVLLNMSGVAKVGANGESALTIYSL